MNTLVINATLFKADQMLRAAQRELLKSHDDAVPFMICSNAQMSIINYLSGYLLEKGITPESPYTIKQLTDQCRELNPKFNDINIEFLNCKTETHNKNYCTDIKKVEACVDIARQVKDIIKDDPWPLSKQVK